MKTAERSGSTEDLFTHDAWNRLVRVRRDTGVSTITISESEYNGMHWRTVRRADTTAAGVPEGLYYYATDAHYSVIAVTNEDAILHERISYTPYGVARHRWGLDVDRDGDFDIDDNAAYTALTGTVITQSTYDPDADLNRDGSIDNGSEDPIYLQWETDRGALGALADGEVSDTDATYGPDNYVSYDGYLFNRESGLHTVRFRTYDAGWGRWLERDPLQFIEGANLYQFVASNPMRYLDRYGLQGEPPWIPIRDWDPPGPDDDWGDKPVDPGGPLPDPLFGPPDPPRYRPGLGNCYRFACDDPRKPGEGRDWHPGKDPIGGSISCDELKKRAMKDGMTEVDSCGNCPLGSSKVAYAIVPPTGPDDINDYHWYRQFPKDGIWRHKPGTSLVEELRDEHGQPVDPERGNRKQYTDFCGYLCAPKGIDIDD